MRRTLLSSSALWALSALSLVSPTTSQQSTLSSKRGLAYLGHEHQQDLDLLLSAKSSIAWYYTWSAYTASDINSTLPFVPLIHGLDDATSSSVMDTISKLPAESTHLLTFNEPDGTTSSGGSSISPSDAAKAYMDDIVPLRSSSSRTWNISHPAVTGSSQGLSWLQDFNASCWELDPSRGCPTDFVALHWYGDFAGLASWLGTLRDFYSGTNSSSGAPDGVRFWVTELALPQQGEGATEAMMNQSMAYLDGLDYVQAYAWYGAFRQGAGGGVSSFTGTDVALFNAKGALTDVGALYLGGGKEGFKAGMTGGAGGSGLGSGCMCGFTRASVLAVAVAALTVGWA